MNFDGDATTVVHRLATYSGIAKNKYLVVGRIDNNLIYYLEEARYVLDVPLHHTLGIRVIRPDILGYELHAADVRVWTFENMLQW